MKKFFSLINHNFKLPPHFLSWSKHINFISLCSVSTLCMTIAIYFSVINCGAINHSDIEALFSLARHSEASISDLMDSIIDANDLAHYSYYHFISMNTMHLENTTLVHNHLVVQTQLLQNISSMLDNNTLSNHMDNVGIVMGNLGNARPNPISLDVARLAFQNTLGGNPSNLLDLMLTGNNILSSPILFTDLQLARNMEYLNSSALLSNFHNTVYNNTHRALGDESTAAILQRLSNTTNTILRENIVVNRYSWYSEFINSSSNFINSANHFISTLDMKTLSIGLGLGVSLSLGIAFYTNVASAVSIVS